MKLLSRWCRSWEKKQVLPRFCFPENPRTDSESTMRASAQCLATVWKAEKMLSHIQKTGYGRRTWNLKFASPVKHRIWVISLKGPFQRKAVMIKTSKQHMKDWDFPVTLSHATPFLVTNAVSLPRTMSSFPGTCLSQSRVGTNLCIHWGREVPSPIEAHVFVLGGTETQVNMVKGKSFLCKRTRFSVLRVCSRKNKIPWRCTPLEVSFLWWRC